MRRTHHSLFFLIFVFAAALVPAQELTHTLDKGQTLYSVAQRYGVPVARLMELNGISDPSHLAVGTEISIPGAYRVQKGDTYYSIARSNGITVDELLSANNRSRSDVLVAGEALYIPGAAASQVDSSAVGSAGGSSGSGSENLSYAASASSLGEPRVANAVVNRDLDWPLDGERSMRNGKFPGITISGNAGDAVVSVSSGRVVYAGPYTAFGKVVFIQSNSGFIYVYAGQGELDVSVGDVVSAGMRIGALGAAPAASDPKLYFSVWKNDRYIDPRNAPRG